MTSVFIASNRPARRMAAGLIGSLGAAALLLVACGGGTSEPAAVAPQSVGLNPQVYSVGPIDGLGSVIVGGVRFDDTAAVVEDQADGRLHDARALKLGMMVAVDAGPIDETSGRARASRVRFGSEIVGPVAAVDPLAGTITVLDQTVEVTETTVYGQDLGGGFEALTPGRVLVVNAMFDAARGLYIATRLDAPPEVPAYMLRGVISGVDAAAQIFRIGAALIDYSQVPQADLVPLADDMRLRVRLQTEPSAGRWVALALQPGVHPVPDRPDVRLRGLVSRFASPQHFAIRGLEVDARQARFEPNEAAVALGAIVAVQGTVRAGVVVARHVKVLNRGDDEWRRVELHGSVSGLDTDAKTFMLREIKVDYSQATDWRNGSEAELADGQRLWVKGGWSVDRQVLAAKIIGFGD